MQLEQFLSNMTERKQAQGLSREAAETEVSAIRKQTVGLMEALQVPKFNPSASAPEMQCRHCGAYIRGRKQRRIHLDECVSLKRKRMLERFAEAHPEFRQVIKEAYNASI